MLCLPYVAKPRFSAQKRVADCQRSDVQTRIGANQNFDPKMIEKKWSDDAWHSIEQRSLYLVTFYAITLVQHD